MNNLLLKKLLRCLFLGILLAAGSGLKAQVTIGAGTPPQDYSILEVVSNGKGGLRLPQLTTDQRKALDLTVNSAEAKGLTIYNSTTGCVEYWNNKKWVSLCQGQANILLKDDNGDIFDPTQEPCIPALGGDKGPFTPVDDPNCTQENPAFDFLLMTGGEYTTVSVIDASTGKFMISMDSNPTARTRTAVLRITNNCTKEYKEFLFSQCGDDAECGTTIIPDIKNNGTTTELCLNGAVYLYLDGHPVNGTFIWTLNGKEMGTDNYLVVTEPGRYIVYGDKIGCSGSKEIIITRGANSAPSPVDFIVVGNNGVACGAGGTVELVVSSTMAGTIVWYKDGQKTSLTGKSIQAGKGTWFAVVEDGSCMSRPSDFVHVVEDTNATSVKSPEISINGQVTGYSLCKGGSMYLKVDNPEAGVKYTWYINNDEIGTGTALYHPVPSGDNFVLRVRATGTGCAAEHLTEETVNPTQAPNPPYITTNTNDMLCGGQATLTALNSPGATSYRWFKDGVELGVTADPYITVNTTGSYMVCAINGSCTSIQSAPKTIAASDFATLSWISHPTSVNAGETKTYSVAMDFWQNATYSWSVDNGAIITNGQGTSSVTVHFPATGTTTVTCTAANACGTAAGSPLSETVTVNNQCSNASITNTVNLNSNIKVGNQVTMSVTAAGTSLTYQWYSGIVGSGTPITGQNGSSYTYTAQAIGNYQFYCIVTPGSPCTSDTSPQFTVAVTADPANIPTGTGTFIGKTCFDIVSGNDNSQSCGSLSGRAGQKTTFSDRRPQDPAAGDGAPYTGVQVYTFVPRGTVSKVHFDYVDGTGSVIQTVTSNGNYDGNNISNPCKVTVAFNPDLDNLLKGLTRQTALKVELYVIYNDAANGQGNERKLKLNLTFQDCACCGAKMEGGGWLSFMCHNLGADESVDPFTYVEGAADGSGGTLGYLYQWGRPAVVNGEDTKYQYRNSPTIPSVATNNEGTLPSETKGRFITSVNWNQSSNTNQQSFWGNGTTDLNSPKAPNDPCPAGWKVPSYKQWLSIYRSTPGVTSPASAKANIWTWTYNGFKVGDALFLPAAGFRSASGGTLSGVGSSGYYWSSTSKGAASSHSYMLKFGKNTVEPNSSISRGQGYSIRCVAE